MLRKAGPSEIGLDELPPLNHRAHGTVEHEDTLRQNLIETPDDARATNGRHGGHLPAGVGLLSFAGNLVPVAMSTAKGSPVFLAPTDTLTSRNRAAPSNRFS